MENLVKREGLMTFSSVGEAAAEGGTLPKSSAENYGWMLLILLLALTAFRLISLTLSNTELFFDEAQYWFWSRELAFGYYSKPPLIGWIIRGATEICGQSEVCIRVPSPLFHGGTAMLIYWIGRTLFDARIGFWSGLTYATLPGVSLSASLISTDVPLLFFVALALLAVVKLRENASWGWAVLLGVAIGCGLLAKYAMVYFVLCLAIYCLWSEAGRSLLKRPHIYVSLLIGGAFLAPNIWWNAQNSFATLSHTADNANWSKSLFNISDALEFIGGQFGVFGPVLFVALLWFCWNWLKKNAVRQDFGDDARLLLAFSVPVITLMILQAFLSRAHANWAAFAYIAGTVLVTAIMLRGGWTRIFRLSLGLHLVVIMAISVGNMAAGRIPLPGGDPYARVLGWDALAQTAAQKAQSEGFRAIATDKRALAAELLYYLRDKNLPVYAIRGDRPPRDHFELARPLTPNISRPVLLVSFSASAPSGAEAVGTEEIAAGRNDKRTVYFYALRSQANEHRNGEPE